MLPLKEEGKAENMLSAKEFVKEEKATGFCYALVANKDEPASAQILVETT